MALGAAFRPTVLAVLAALSFSPAAGPANTNPSTRPERTAAARAVAHAGAADETSAPGPRARWELLAGPLDPPPMHGHVAVHDPIRRRLLMINGDRPDELWSLSLPGSGSPEWTRAEVGGPDYPSPRLMFTAAFDSASDRVVVYGGWSGSYGNGNGDTWVLELEGAPRWRRIVPSGAAPTGGAHQVGAFDARRRQLWVFGATDDGAFDQLWRLDLAGAPAWHRVETPGLRPVTREGARMVVDPWGDRLVMFGGWHQVDATLDYRILDDTWVFPLDGPAGWDSLPLGVRPRARQMYAAALDTDRRRLVVSGGSAWQGHPYLADTWELRLDGTPAWEPVATTGTSAGEVAWHAGAYSPERRSLVHYGGIWTLAQSQCYELALGDGRWSRVDPPAPSPFPGRHGAWMFEDPLTRHTLMWFGELWATGEPPARYTPLASSGDPRALGYVVDTRRRRLLALGGNLYWSRDGRLDQVWEMPLDEPRRWSRIEVPGPQPPGRMMFGIVYDARRDRVLVYGGIHYGSVAGWMVYAVGDLWELSLDPPRWTKLEPANPPTDRGGGEVLLDASRDRLLVFGGAGGGVATTHPVEDSWALDLSGEELRWSALGPIPGRGRAVLDANRDRVVMWSGGAGAWSLPLTDGAAWTPIATGGFWPEPRSESGVCFEADRDRMLVYGGSVAGGFPSGVPAGDLYALRFSETVAVVVRPEGDDGAIRLGSRGLVGAAILADAAFSPESLIVESVTLAGARAELNAGRAHRVRRDMNGDGRPDLVLRFRVDSLQLAPGDTVAILRGATPAFEVLGRAPVRVTGARRVGHHDRAAIPVASAGHALALRLPSPAAGAVRASFALPSSEPARLELFDVAGRRTYVREWSGLDPGWHEVTLDGARLPSGLFLARLSQAGRAVSARVAVVR